MILYSFNQNRDYANRRDSCEFIDINAGGGDSQNSDWTIPHDGDTCSLITMKGTMFNFEDWAKSIEQGPMRRAEYRHFPTDMDASDNPIFFEITVPYLALVVAENPATPGRPGLPFRTIGDEQGVPKLQSFREFCAERHIPFRQCDWDAGRCKIIRDGRWGNRILIFENQEHQRMVAQAFAGKLR